MTTRYFIYNEIPGTHPTWTVAMLAVSRKDADRAMKVNWRGGKFVCEIGQGKVKADCGDLTEAARLEIVFKSREVSGYVGLDGISSVKESGNAAAVVEFADGASDTGLSGGVVGEGGEVGDATASSVGWRGSGEDDLGLDEAIEMMVTGAEEVANQLADMVGVLIRRGDVGL